MSEWIVTWPGDSRRMPDEASAERLERVLVREFGIAATRRQALAPVEQMRQRVRVPGDEVLVEQVRDEQKEARP